MLPCFNGYPHSPCCSENKLQPPTQIVKYLGVIVDSISMELRLPEEKIIKMKSVLHDVRQLKSISRKKLESLTGVLAHCATVVRGGRLFCRRLYDLYKVMIKKSLSVIYVPVEVKKDIDWWIRFGEVFNGRAAIANPVFDHHMYSGASLKGWGVFIGRDWFTGAWNADEHLDFTSSCDHIIQPSSEFSLDLSNINELELWPIFVALSVWYPRLRHTTLILHSDNTQVVALLTNYVSTNANCLRILRELFWILVYNDIQLDVRHIPSADNVLADTLSRLYYPDNWDRKCDVICHSSLCCNGEFSSFLRRFGSGSRENV